jgi:hypothetical protein
MVKLKFNNPMNIKIAQIALLFLFLGGCDGQSSYSLNHFEIIADPTNHTIIKLDKRNGSTWRLDEYDHWKPLVHRSDSDLAARIRLEKERRSKIYKALSQAPKAKVAIDDYKKGLVDQSATRNILQNLIPDGLGTLPLDAENGAWLDI